jgi:hypothetical protein
LKGGVSEAHPKDYEVAVAANGFITSPLALKFLQHFDRHTKNRAGKSKFNGNLDNIELCNTNVDSSLLDEYRLLIFDGHKTHLTAEFLDYCMQSKIIPFCLLAHTLHLVQPLDGKPFLVYKTFFRSWNRKMAAWGGDCTEKRVFLDAIGPIRERTFTPQLIRKAFRERGIYPFYPDIITGPMSEAEWEASPEIKGFNPLGNHARGIIRALSPTQSSSDIDVLVSPRRIRKSIEKVKVFIDASSNATPLKQR